MAELTPKDAYQLFHEGTLALADVEANGIRVDVAKLDKNIKRVERRIEDNLKKLKRDEVWEKWKGVYGEKANIGSRTQLGKIIFEHLGYECTQRTEKTGRAKVSEETLQDVNIPFTRAWLKIEHFRKFLSTSLKGIRNELVGDRVHAIYDLHLAISFRSRCERPNMQNQPIREPVTGKLIRECFIASPNHHIMEADFGSLEFLIACCFWCDDTMIEYANDETRDIHRDMATECYHLPENAVPKDCRFYTKNQFVFPQLYGSDYVACSRNLWHAIETAKLKTADGIPLRRHLRRELGIKKLGRCSHKFDPFPGTYEYYIRRVQNNFNKRFSQYAARKEVWWEKYKETRQFRLMTGFDVRGVYRKNQVYNIPIQGPAFHCLLWSLIRMNNWLKENNMRTKIVGTVHDSIVFDVHKDELGIVMRKCKEVMTKDIRKVWDWIIVPLKVEFEASPVNGSWWEKKEIDDA